MKIINIANDFSEYPGARYFSDGPFSGEEFYKNILKPTFENHNNEKIKIIIDGTNGFATSFLEEAFGSLSKEFGAKKVLSIIELVSEDEPYLVKEIRDYINEAYKR